MLEFVAHYWLQILFGLIVSVVAACNKKIRMWYSTHKEKEQDQFKHSIVEGIKPMLEELAERSDENDKVMKQQMEELRAGVLSVQGDAFKEKCRMLIHSEEPITLEQFEQLNRDHDAYNGLGGNHDGDALFDLVKKKYEHQL